MKHVTLHSRPASANVFAPLLTLCSPLIMSDRYCISLGRMDGEFGIRITGGIEGRDDFKGLF